MIFKKIARLISDIWFNLFIYSSITFLIYYLAKSDILHWPIVYQANALFLSIIFLFIGFLLEMYAWFKLLKLNNIDVNYETIVVSSGMAILGKYLPGKLWTIIGRAKIVADRSAMPLSKISLISLESQLIFLWTGLVISLIGAISAQIDLAYILTVTLFLFLFSLLIFSMKLKRLVEIFLRQLFKKEFSIPNFNNRKGIIILLNIIPWISWTIGFYLLALSISNFFINFSISYSFVISATFGVIALFSPGGLGVREGIMTAYLTICGLDITTATTISVFSRLWFLVGETSVFILAILLNFSSKRFHK